MFIAPDSRWLRRGFTLLEITFAVVILAMMSIAIYRFVQSNLAAMRLSSEQNATDARYDGLHDLLSTEWQSLSPSDGQITGEPYKFEGRSRDQITWVTEAGPGLLTRYAGGEYEVTMRLRPAANKKDGNEIGFSRKPDEDNTGNETWIPLLENVESLQIRYYDPRLNSWIDRWTDTITLPRLVKLTIGRSKNSVPWETIIALGRTPL